MSFLNLMRNRLKPKAVNDALTKVVQKSPPDFSSSDAGKVLGVDSDGKLEWRNETSYVPPAYSTSEVNTGQKWIDGKTIFKKTYVSNTEISIVAGNQGNNITTLIDNKSNIEQIIGCFATNESANGYMPLTVDNDADKVIVYTFVGNTFKTLTLLYTKVVQSKKKTK